MAFLPTTPTKGRDRRPERARLLKTIEEPDLTATIAALRSHLASRTPFLLARGTVVRIVNGDRDGVLDDFIGQIGVVTGDITHDARRAVSLGAVVIIDDDGDTRDIWASQADIEIVVLDGPAAPASSPAPPADTAKRHTVAVPSIGRACRVEGIGDGLIADFSIGTEVDLWKVIRIRDGKIFESWHRESDIHLL